MSPVRGLVSREPSPNSNLVQSQRRKKTLLHRAVESNESTVVSVRLNITKQAKRSRVNSLGSLQVKPDTFSNSTGRGTNRSSKPASRPSSLERKIPKIGFGMKLALPPKDKLEFGGTPEVFMIDDTESSAEDERETFRRQILSALIEKCYLRHGVVPTTTPEFYRYGKLLGKGAFGKVILAVHALSGQKVAIKYIEKSYMKDERRKRKVIQEILAMRTVNHPNVIQLYEVFESNSHLLMVIQYAQGGDLLHFVRDRGRLNEDEARKLFRQVVEAVKACHIKNIIHRDVKLDNVLLDKHCSKAILCDFGVCRTLKRGELIREHCGTPAYLAPEIIANLEYDGFYVDFWSLGVLLFAMVTGTLPFRAKTLPDLQKLILKGRYELPEYLSNEVCDVIDGLLQLVPQQRLSFEELLQHSWMTRFTYTLPTAPVLKKDQQEHCLKLMKRMGFNRLMVLQSLKMKEMNHATATFALLCEGG